MSSSRAGIAELEPTGISGIRTYLPRATIQVLLSSLAIRWLDLTGPPPA